MNWQLLFVKLMPIVIGSVIIFLSYKIPPSMIRDIRKDKMKAATVWEIIWLSSVTLLSCAILAGLISFNDNEQPVTFTVWLSISVIPATVGLWRFFENDSKKTITERVIDNINIAKEQKEAAEHQSEF